MNSKAIVKLSVLVVAAVAGAVAISKFAVGHQVAPVREAKKEAKPADKPHVAAHTSGSAQGKTTQQAAGKSGQSDSGGELFK